MLKLLKFLVVLGVLFIFFIAIAGGFLLIISGGQPVAYLREVWLRVAVSARQEDLERVVITNDVTRSLVVEPGDTPISIAQKLYQAGLIDDPQLFTDYFVVESLDTQLQQGLFFLNPSTNIIDIARTITQPTNAIVFTISPGMRIEEIAELVNKTSQLQFSGDEFLVTVDTGAQIDPLVAQQLGIPQGASLEGFMFPDTYIVPPDISALGLRETLLQGFLSGTGTQLALDAAENGFTMRDIVSIASIVEREAVWNDEHTLIASAYHNRLEIGMKLEADPTIQYALDGSRGRWWPAITRADYRDVISPYNMYLHGGLPPSPIASPSLSAIRAATYPAESSYIYFRARCDGSNYHSFATTFDEHLANGC